MRECERRALLQGEEREALLKRGRLRLYERHASLLGEEREAVLERQSARVCEACIATGRGKGSFVGAREVTLCERRVLLLGEEREVDQRASPTSSPARIAPRIHTRRG